MQGAIRITEQGEVIAAKYGTRESAEANLEAIASAPLLASLEKRSGRRRDRFYAAIEQVSGAAFRAYRELVYETEGFDRCLGQRCTAEVRVDDDPGGVDDPSQAGGRDRQGVDHCLDDVLRRQLTRTAAFERRPHHLLHHVLAEPVRGLAQPLVGQHGVRARRTPPRICLHVVLLGARGPLIGIVSQTRGRWSIQWSRCVGRRSSSGDGRGPQNRRDPVAGSGGFDSRPPPPPSARHCSPSGRPIEHLGWDHDDRCL